MGEQHMPLLLKCYEQVQGQHYCYITKSNWQCNARDTTLCLKTMGPGSYLIVTEFVAPLHSGGHKHQPQNADKSGGGGEGNTVKPKALGLGAALSAGLDGEVFTYLSVLALKQFVNMK